jgi:hypothetical protein
VLVFIPKDGLAAPDVDVFMFFHGIYAEYDREKDKSDVVAGQSVRRENPAQNSHMAEAVSQSGRNLVAIAPEFGDHASWESAEPDTFKLVMETVLKNLSAELGTPQPLKPAHVSVAGHSAGGRGIGRATEEMGDLVTDVTLQDAGYGIGEKKGDLYGKSFEKVRDWLLMGKGPKTLRVISKDAPQGADKNEYNTRHVLTTKKGFNVQSFRDRIEELFAAHKIDHKLQVPEPEIVDDKEQRDAGMKLEQKVQIMDNGQLHGTLCVYSIATHDHWEVRNRTMADAMAAGTATDAFGLRHAQPPAATPASPTAEQHAHPELHRTMWERVFGFWKSDEVIIEHRLKERGDELSRRMLAGELTPEQAAQELREHARGLEGEVPPAIEAAALAMINLGHAAAQSRHAEEDKKAATTGEPPRETHKGEHPDHAKAEHKKAETVHQINQAATGEQSGKGHGKAAKKKHGGYDTDESGHDTIGNLTERIDPNRKAPSGSQRVFTNSFTVVDKHAALLDEHGKKTKQTIETGTRVFVHRANDHLVQIVTADHDASPAIVDADNRWLKFSSLGGHGSNVAFGNEQSDSADKARADKIRADLPPGRNPGQSKHKWGFAGNFLPSLDGASLDSGLMAKVHQLMEWAIYNDMVTGDIEINSGMRSLKQAQTMCVAYEILEMETRKNITMEALQKLPDGKDSDGVVWYQKGDTMEDVQKRASQHTKGHIAAAGYTHGDPRRAPLGINSGPGVSRHCTGHAVDVTIPWRSADGSGTDVWAWEHVYHQFGLTRPLHKDRGVAKSLQENWHIEETEKQILDGNRETEE